jgi:hypothetical protein
MPTPSVVEHFDAVKDIDTSLVARQVCLPANPVEREARRSTDALNISA